MGALGSGIGIEETGHSHFASFRRQISMKRLMSETS